MSAFSLGLWRGLEGLLVVDWCPVEFLSVVVLIPHEGVGVWPIHLAHVVETLISVV